MLRSDSFVITKEETKLLLITSKKVFASPHLTFLPTNDPLHRGKSLLQQRVETFVKHFLLQRKHDLFRKTENDKTHGRTYICRKLFCQICLANPRSFRQHLS